jgi:hypothetical protein
MLVRDSGSTQSEACRNSNFTITNLIWTALRLNPGQRGEMLKTNA